MQVDNYTVQNRTNAHGQFFYRLDTTIPRRHVVRVLRLSGATGRRQCRSPPRERAALLRVAGGFSVGYRVNELSAQRPAGTWSSPVASRTATARRCRRSCSTPTGSPGTITDAAGKPVAGATVVTRTQDRDFWTFSQPSDSSGHYVSFFTASDETGADPVPLTVQVASGNISYASPINKNVNFASLHSATMDVRLPAPATRRSAAAVGDVVSRARSTRARSSVSPARAA